MKAKYTQITKVVSTGTSLRIEYVPEGQEEDQPITLDLCPHTDHVYLHFSGIHSGPENLVVLPLQNAANGAIIRLIPQNRRDAEIAIAKKQGNTATMKKLRANDKVVVLRDITRREGPYAKAGETGQVQEVFGNCVGSREPKRWFAKVKMTDRRIKTFRVTSLGKVES